MSAFPALPERLDLTNLPGALDPLLLALRGQALARTPASATGLSEEEPLVISGSHLRYFDSAALAALVGLIREGSELGFRVRFEHLPEGLVSLASIYGLHAELGASRA
jgi:ABC-type transporter Mla MlaB component